MTVNDLAIQTLSRLPDNGTGLKLKSASIFVAGLRKGLDELDHGEGIAHNVVKEEFAEWLSEQSGRHPPGWTFTT